MLTTTTRCAAWFRHCVHRLNEMPDLVRRILEDLEEMGYSPKERFGIRLALEEALVNAVKHGNRCDESKMVRVRYQATEAQFMVEIEDEGQGFSRADLPDCADSENLERPCGRGVALMEHYMTTVRYNDRGNCVQMIKSRS